MAEPMELSTLRPGVRLSEWITAAPIGMTATYDLLKALGIEPARVRVPGVSTPVAWLSPQQQDAMDQGAAAIGRGRTIGELTTTIQAQTANDREQEHEQQEPPALGLLVRNTSLLLRQPYPVFKSIPGLASVLFSLIGLWRYSGDWFDWFLGLVLATWFVMLLAGAQDKRRGTTGGHRILDRTRLVLQIAVIGLGILSFWA